MMENESRERAREPEDLTIQNLNYLSVRTNNTPWGKIASDILLYISQPPRSLLDGTSVSLMETPSSS